MLLLFKSLFGLSLSLTKKLLVVVCVYGIILSLFVKFTTPNVNQPRHTPMASTRTQIYSKIREFEAKKTKEGILQARLYQSLVCATTGEACKDKNQDKNFNNSFSGFLTKALITPLIHPPASGIEWTIAGLQNAGFIPQTYAAQGIGFTALKPLTNLWKTLRDLAYIIMVVILIAISFMIMFRMKLNAQTVISIENALPRIVTSLILITFSFAIAGFLIDAMYFSISITISIIAKAGNYDVVRMNGEIIQARPTQILNFLMGHKNYDLFNFLNLAKIGYELINLVGPLMSSIVLGLINTFLTAVWTAPWVKNFLVGDFFTNLIPEFNVSLGVGFTTQAFKSFIASPLGALVSFGLGFVITGLLIPLLFALIILLTVIYLFFRIFFLLLDSYIRILLLVVFSPLIMMLDAIPGQSTFTFDGWIKNLIGELATFPILVAIIGVGTIIIDIPLPSGDLNPLNQGSYLWAPPYLFGINPSAFGFILGMTILFLTPDLITQFKKMILPKALPIPEVGPGVFFGGIGAGLGGGIGEISKYGSLTHGIQGLKGVAQRFQIKIPGLT